MANKKLNFITNIILPLFVIAITITLFLMFRPAEPSSLFYLNMGYTIFLEAVFFGYINLLYARTPSLSTPFFAVFGIYAMYYVIIGILVMLIYSLVVTYTGLPLKFYVATIMVLTAAWIILSLLTAKTDSEYKNTVDVLKEQQHSLEYYTQKISLLASRYEKICSEKGLKYQTDSNNRSVLDKLKNKISFLTPNVFRSETLSKQLKEIFEKCESLIEETETAVADDLAELDRKMQRFVSNAVEELDMLKNLTRK
jgi:hypothetical protein